MSRLVAESLLNTAVPVWLHHGIVGVHPGLTVFIVSSECAYRETESGLRFRRRAQYDRLHSRFTR